MAAKTDTNTAEGFIGSIFKFSISTFANIGIFGLAMVLTSLFIAPEAFGQIDLFIGYTNTIMTIAILGLDQALIRFYYKPPEKLSKSTLFRICFYFSAFVLFVGGTVCSTLLLVPLYNGLGFFMVGYNVIPFLFLNAFFFMVLRYFNVLYRMEMNIKIYTAESILMQFFYKLFYIVGSFFGFENPVPAMMVCSLVGLGGFALIFCFLRRDILRPQKSEFKRKNLRAILPYGIATAPTAVFVTLNGILPKSYITNTLGGDAAGIYSYAYSLSNMVTLIQGGFASFWGAYMFQNYETQKERIMRVHNYLNLIILCFFAFLIVVEDIIFWILSGYSESMAIFPLMMLAAVFTILCETTVYGNAIARKPIFDTIGIGLSLVSNILFCVLLIGPFNIYGAACAVVIANFVMFLFRTLTAQKLYRTISSPAKTVAAVAVAIFLGIAGTVYASQFVIRLCISLACIIFYCLLYRQEFVYLFNVGISILKSLFKKKTV